MIFVFIKKTPTQSYTYRYPTLYFYYPRFHTQIYKIYITYIEALGNNIIYSNNSQKEMIFKTRWGGSTNSLFFSGIVLPFCLSPCAPLPPCPPATSHPQPLHAYTVHARPLRPFTFILYNTKQRVNPALN